MLLLGGGVSKPYRATLVRVTHAFSDMPNNKEAAYNGDPREIHFVMMRARILEALSLSQV